MFNWIGWTFFRIIITIMCALTMTNIIQAEGYRVEYSAMFVGAACIVLLIIIWSPRCKNGS